MATYASILELVTPRWLLDATDPARIRQSLEAVEPALGPAGTLVIDKCKVKLRVLGADGCWLGSVPLLVRSREIGPAEERLLGASFAPPALRGDLATEVHGEFAHPDWRCSIGDLGLRLTTLAGDKELPARALLIDAERVKGLLQASIRGARPEWAHAVVVACHPEEARHKLGSRCTVRYRLSYGPDDISVSAPRPPPLVVAKTYRSGDGTGTYAAMRALWESPLALSSTVAIAEPLAYHRDLDVMIQGPVREEITLKALIARAFSGTDQDARERLDPLLLRSAQGLAELHACGVTEGPGRRWQDEFREIEFRLSAVARAIPAVAGLGGPLLEHAGNVLGDRPPPAVPSHGGFRVAQVLVSGTDIGFIDFDSFCQAEPAMDLAEFVRFLIQEGFGEPEDPDDPAGEERLGVLDALAEQVVAQYQAFAAVDPDRVVAWQALGWLNRLLAGWAKGKTDRLSIDARLLDHFLARHDLPSAPFS